jgi:hypothetical protein
MKFDIPQIKQGDLFFPELTDWQKEQVLEMFKELSNRPKPIRPKQEKE